MLPPKYFRPEQGKGPHLSSLTIQPQGDVDAFPAARSADRFPQQRDLHVSRACSNPALLPDDLRKWHVSSARKAPQQSTEGKQRPQQASARTPAEAACPPARVHPSILDAITAKVAYRSKAGTPKPSPNHPGRMGLA